MGHKDRALAIGGACNEAAGNLTRLLGNSDCVGWLKAAARVNMEVDEVPNKVLRTVATMGHGDDSEDFHQRLNQWLAGRIRMSRAAVPPDFSEGPAPVAPQTYEPEPEDSPGNKPKEARGVPKLPVRELRGQLADILGDNGCLVISGGTGSGKSTQVPQYIIDDFQPEDPTSDTDPTSDGDDDKPAPPAGG